MRLLLDTCVWGGASVQLQASGHDVRWVGELPSDPGDDPVIKMASSEGRILVTLDKDFGELAIVYGRPHCGIIRLVNIPAREQSRYCQIVLKRYGPELARRAIVTATTSRIRIRSAEPDA